MDLYEFSSEERLRREAAADRIRQIADQLARHNRIELDQDGRRVTIDVPDEVELAFEVEIGDEGSEIEIELRW